MKDLLTATEHEQGQWLEIVSPITMKPTGVKFKVIGIDSKAYRKAQFENMKAVKQADQFEQVEEANLRFYRALIIDVEGLEEEVTVEDVLRLAPYVQDQMAMFVANRRNFTTA